MVAKANDTGNRQIDFKSIRQEAGGSKCDSCSTSRGCTQINCDKKLCHKLVWWKVWPFLLRANFNKHKTSASKTKSISKGWKDSQSKQWLCKIRSLYTLSDNNWNKFSVVEILFHKLSNPRKKIFFSFCFNKKIQFILELLT